MTNWIITDTHFYHANIAIYCNRPSNWNELILDAWRAKVNPRDRIYHLGDVTLQGPRGDYYTYIHNTLPGYKILIKGNHDRISIRYLGTYWDEIYTLLPMEIYGYNCLLSHKPQFNRKDIDFNIHGHNHNVIPTNPGNTILLALEIHGYEPLILEDWFKSRVNERGLECPKIVVSTPE